MSQDSSSDWHQVVSEVAKDPGSFKVSGIGRGEGLPTIFSPVPEIARAKLSSDFQGLNWASVDIKKAKFRAFQPFRFNFMNFARQLWQGLLAPAVPITEGLQPGERIGNASAKGGTLGCLLTNGTESYLLSANHALPSAGIFKKDAINKVQISSKSIQIGKVRGAKDPIDCAVALLEDSASDQVTLSFVPWIKCDTVKQRRFETVGAPSLKIGDPVLKCGGETHLRAGLVYDPKMATVTVKYGSTVHTFVDQIAIVGGPAPNLFATEGDSGSIVYRKVGGKLDPLGLMFAKSEDSLYFLVTPMAKILTEVKKVVPGLHLP